MRVIPVMWGVGILAVLGVACAPDAEDSDEEEAAAQQGEGKADGADPDGLLTEEKPPPPPLVEEPEDPELETWQPHCTGNARDCSFLDGFQCGRTAGCSLSGDCQGNPVDCRQLAVESMCVGVAGCYWNKFSDSCAGMAHSCWTFEEQGGCLLQKGCRWDESCSGMTRPCSVLTVEECMTQQGCWLDE